LRQESFASCAGAPLSRTLARPRTQRHKTDSLVGRREWSN
jgi:hypothetical protein